MHSQAKERCLVESRHSCWRTAAELPTTLRVTDGLGHTGQEYACRLDQTRRAAPPGQDTKGFGW